MDQNMNAGGSDMGQKYPSCRCMHHSMVPWAIILIGVLVLLQAFNAFSMKVAAIILGILIIFIGGNKLNAHRCNCCMKDKIK